MLAMSHEGSLAGDEDSGEKRLLQAESDASSLREDTEDMSG